MSGVKRKRNVLNVKQKLEILQKLANGESDCADVDDVLNEGNTISHSAALQSVETFLDYMGQRGFDYGDITAKVGLRKTINAAVSCQTLRRLRRAILTFGVAFIPDNARPHSAIGSQQLLEQFNWDLSDDPEYIPDLATSDFHLFPELKNYPGGQSIQKIQETQSKVKAHLSLLVATFFEEGIGNLIYRYAKCLNLHGDYAEK
ncbi:hypothetical protein AVEN_169438-1 [Araneus ventricosus]|uniref:Histone-lysine N-methyltransferase SETMAR n=1 Tax=Araneus ventricosus TaxID=182803 RepID=A0A4Y2LFF8_ARAVE|nr:hypothetical protein AVEN_169438-1 [Araneus ventricosus]